MHPGKQKDPASGLAVWIARGKVWFDPSAPEVHGTAGLYLYFLHFSSAANDRLRGKGSVGTRRERQTQMYLSLWLSLLGTEITGFLAHVPRTDFTEQSPSCSPCHICSAALLGEANFAAPLK